MLKEVQPTATPIDEGVRRLWWPAWPPNSCQHWVGSGTPVMTSPGLVIPADLSCQPCCRWTGLHAGGSWCELSSAGPARRDWERRTPGNSAWSSHPGRRKAPDWGSCWCSRGRCRNARWRSAGVSWEWSPEPWWSQRCGSASSRRWKPPPPPGPYGWCAVGCGPSPWSQTTCARSSGGGSSNRNRRWWWGRAWWRQRWRRRSSGGSPSTREGGERAKYSQWLQTLWK